MGAEEVIIWEDGGGGHDVSPQLDLEVTSHREAGREVSGALVGIGHT